MILALIGPTASGKTSISLSLAKKNNAEIINADALQVYQKIEWMSCAPSEEEKAVVPHHLYSFLDPAKPYDIYQYQKDARAVIEDILARGKTPLLVGGSGLYLRAALYDYQLKNETNNVDLQRYLSLSNEALHEELEKLDPLEAKKIHPNNRVRTLRAIEICLVNGKRKSDLIPTNGPKLFYPDTHIYLLQIEREKLYENIEKRCKKLFAGTKIEEEIFPLFASYGCNAPAFKAIGVKELIPYYEGKITREEAFQKVVLDTRHYAKRQMTFFRHQFKEAVLYDN